MPSILLRTPFDGPWLRLEDPAAVITADRPSDVVPALAAAEAAARGGSYVAGFVTYEAAAAFGLAVHEVRGAALPLAWFGVFPPDRVQRLDAIPAAAGAADPARWTPAIDRHDYLSAVRRIKDFIADGETYQLNFTFRLHAPFAGDPRAAFEHLVRAQGGAWSAYLDLGDWAICSASPELFFRLEHGRIECRPMKGTLPRGLTPADDLTQGERLRSSLKNRSENVMIVDLMRNDLGRVARISSVEVSSLYDLERYPAQWQMTSTVTADVGAASLPDIFGALFPSGSVTGAPKNRSMEIIRDLETSRRGMYTGAIGLIDPRGRVHFNVAIRTVVVDRPRQQAEFGVGSGIVWESQEADEFEECQTKAAILTSRAPSFELLETMRWDVDAGYVLLDRHLARLRASAEYFGFPYREHAIRNELGGVLRDPGTGREREHDAKVRLLLDATGSIDCGATDLDVKAGAWRTALASSPVSSRDVFLYHKTTHRDVYDAARRSRPDADAVLLWNEAGEITEATDFNIVIELDGRRVTPPIECGLLAGTMRADLLERGEIAEQRISREDLWRATRVWLINSVRGWIDTELID